MSKCFYCRASDDKSYLHILGIGLIFLYKIQNGYSQNDNGHRIIIGICSLIGLLALMMYLSSTIVLAQDSSLRPRLSDPSLKVEEYVTGLELPTQMKFINQTDILILEKNKGTVRQIHDGVLQPEPVLDVNVATDVDRGLLGIESVQKQSNHTRVFLYFTESPRDDAQDVTNGTEPLGNRLYRYDFLNGKLVNPKLLLSLPSKPSAEHNGGAMTIGPDNNLYLTMGDLGYRQTKAENENLAEPVGTSGILRLDQDGKPVGKGIIGSDFPTNLYYAYGIRNSYGMAFDPLSGKLWDTENGPAFGDEINLVDKGFNSGWRQIQGIWQRHSVPEWDVVGNNISYVFDGHSDDILQGFQGKGHYSAPEFVWNETIGPTALTFFHSDTLGPKYRDDIFVADVKHGRLYNFDLNEKRTGLSLVGNLSDRLVGGRDEARPVIFGEDFGGTNFNKAGRVVGTPGYGVTDLEVGPDGYLYVVSIGAGKIYRIVPINPLHKN